MTSIAFQRDLPRRINKWLRRCKEIKRGNGCQTQEDGRDSRKSACSGLTVRSDLSLQPNYHCYSRKVVSRVQRPIPRIQVMSETSFVTKHFIECWRVAPTVERFELWTVHCWAEPRPPCWQHYSLASTVDLKCLSLTLLDCDVDIATFC